MAKQPKTTPGAKTVEDKPAEKQLDFENMPVPKIRKKSDRRRRIHVDLSKPGPTEQHHRDQCNINQIAKRAMRTGMVPPPEKPLQFMDCPAITYHEALEYVRQAEDAFETLPAATRREYQNNPGALLEAINQVTTDPDANPELREKLEQQGVVLPREKDTTQSAQKGGSQRDSGQPKGKGQGKGEKPTGDNTQSSDEGGETE